MTLNPLLQDDYYQAIIGNGRTCAIVEPDSTISFCCMPDFDSGTVFAALLDTEKGGRFGVSIEGGEAVSQEYEQNTNILVTRFESPEGSFEVVDFMPRYTWDGKAGTESDIAADIVRVLRPISGTPSLCVQYDPKLDYARFETETQIERPGRLKSTTRGFHEKSNKSIYESLYLYTDLPVEAAASGKPTKLTKTSYLFLSYNDKVQEPDAESIDLMLQRTRSYWMLWCARTLRPTKYAAEVTRSALALKLLQFGPTGAFCAAGTTSLPESIGEERNWDYRFCWIRDASMTVSILHRIGHPHMATRFVDWVLRTCNTKDDALQIMYGLRGETNLTEYELDHLSGYLGSSPVRIGNGAYDQTQHDIYGVLLDVVWQDLQNHDCRPNPRTPEVLDRIWTRVRSVVRTVEETWNEPDRGIWEIRGANRHFMFSKVLCWVAVDRAIKIARMLGKHEWADLNEPLRNEIHDTACKKGWNEKAGAYTQSFGSEHLDSSNLLMADYGFIDGKDERFVATVKATQERLTHNGLLYRYRNQDDFGEPTSAFTVCSFWMVKALVATGQRKQATTLFEKLLAAANCHGLYGEDLDFETLRHLGNFPQAYSHLALIDCATALSQPESSEDDTPDKTLIQA